jgi:Flp pilus assembly protein CpaB
VATSATTPPPAAAPSGSAAASKVFLLVAVLLGLLATVLAFFFISSAGSSNTGPKVKIVVAKHDMSPNLPLDPTRDLMVIDVPTQFKNLASQCLDTDATALKGYKGKRINREILTGQPVMLQDLKETEFLVLEKPYMALTLTAETGILIPGDYVKLIVAKPNLVGAVATMPVAGVSAYETTIIGSGDGFKVLAVGAYLYKTRQQALYVDPTNSAVNAANKTVTLQVTEAQAKEIMNALGSLSSTNKVPILLCPSEKTAPAKRTDEEPSTPAAPAAPRKN